MKIKQMSKLTAHTEILNVKFLIPVCKQVGGGGSPTLRAAACSDIILLPKIEKSNRKTCTSCVSRCI